MNPWCTVEGCGRAATDVDHIESIAQAPHRRLDRSNLRSFCHPHHSQRTARDQGFAKSSSANELRGSRHPEWLRPACVPFTLVSGPPGAGKTTWVEAHKGPADLVLDLDVIIAKLSGQPIFCATSDTWRDQALRWRNVRLSLLSYIHRWPAAWLVIMEPRPKWRAWWTAKMGARSVVLESEPRACIDNLMADTRRPALVKDKHAELATWWWSAYQRRPEDLIIRAGHRPTTGAALCP